MWPLLVLLTLCGPVLADETPVASDVEAVYNGGDYQTDLPGVTEPLPQPETAPQQPEETTDLSWLGKAIGFVLKWLSVAGFAAAAIVVLLLAYRTWQSLRLRPRRSDREGDDGELDADGRSLTPASAHFADAEALAREGAYAEAIHVLLLAVVDSLRRRTGQAIAPAMTARELVHAPILSERHRDDFASLVASSERGHFGGRPADVATFEQCREQARRLADAAARG